MRTFRYHYFVAVFLAGAFACFAWAASSWSVGMAQAENPQDITIPKITALKLQPDSLVLAHKRDVRRVLVSGRTEEGYWIDLSRAASFTLTSSTVQIDSEGYLHPIEAGTTKVTVSVSGKSVDLPVTVRSVDEPPISFVRDIMPTISKIGCNAGTCHGAAKGKNGFKFSLRGYDPDFDYQSLIHDISGRRFNRAFPEQSLMLRKPTADVPHKGGQVIKPDSRNYRLFHQWIAEGVVSDVKSTQRVERLEVFPKSVEIAMPDMTQQMLVIAHYPDGETRDVTRDAIYTSSASEVATVTDDGFVTAVRRGETSILTRYEGAYGANAVIVMGDRSGFQWVETPEYNEIDTLVHNKLKRLKILPSELCTDEAFMRRVHLDLIGLPPTPSQVRAFLSDTTASKAKREKLIDALLDTPEFVQHWTHKWADLLQCNRKFLGEKGAWLFRSWIQNSIAQNKPYDQFVRELLTASGSTYKNPAANYYRVSREYQPAVENTTQLFLGVRFQCNVCHDHPFEKWTQNQFYELAAYFGKVGVKPGQLPGEEIVYTKYSGGEVTHPKTADVVMASVPYGKADEVGSGGNPTQPADPRLALAKWLTAPENPLFARSGANRIWSYFMGRGIIEPVDDVRTSNPPSNPELLDALTDDFIKSGFDVKHLMRKITRSRTYQQSIKTNRWNTDDTINFSHAVPRRLTAEQLLDAITVATGSPPKFDDVPRGFRAVQLLDSKVKDDGFLKLFGRPERESSCECERTTEVSLAHAMNLINGPTVADAVIDPDGRIVQLMKDAPDDRAVVEEIYLATLSRMPRANEYETALTHLSEAESKAEGAQDLLWALINSPAFLFNR